MIKFFETVAKYFSISIAFIPATSKIKLMNV